MGPKWALKTTSTSERDTRHRVRAPYLGDAPSPVAFALLTCSYKPVSGGVQRLPACQLKAVSLCAPRRSRYSSVKSWPTGLAVLAIIHNQLLLASIHNPLVVVVM